MNLIAFRPPHYIILLLTAILLAVSLFFIVSITQASAQWQMWYFSNIDSGYNAMNGSDIYYMYKGDNNNETANYVVIPDDQYRIWIADQAAQGTVTFNVTATCYWNIGLGLAGADTDVDWDVGRWDPDTAVFSPLSGNTLTLYEGDYLAVKLTDNDSNTNAVNVRVTWTLFPPWVGTYIAWSCDNPPYPVPDVYAWLMFVMGAGGIGLLVRILYKRKAWLRPVV